MVWQKKNALLIFLLIFHVLLILFVCHYFDQGRRSCPGASCKIYPTNKEFPYSWFKLESSCLGQNFCLYNPSDHAKQVQRGVRKCKNNVKQRNPNIPYFVHEACKQYVATNSIFGPVLLQVKRKQNQILL